MIKINPWINFNGNAEQAFTFYKSILGGEFTKIVRFKDIANADFKPSEQEENKIMSITLSFGKDSFLIGNDIPEFMGKVSENENRSKILINTESKDEANRIFKELSAGGSVEGDMGESPWGSYFGMFRDKFGIEWMVEFVGN
jgi:PhnB protein